MFKKQLEIGIKNSLPVKLAVKKPICLTGLPKYF